MCQTGSITCKAISASTNSAICHLHSPLPRTIACPTLCHLGPRQPLWISTASDLRLLGSPQAWPSASWEFRHLLISFQFDGGTVVICCAFQKIHGTIELKNSKFAKYVSQISPTELILIPGNIFIAPPPKESTMGTNATMNLHRSLTESSQRPQQPVLQ